MCRIEGCQNKPIGKGLCAKHYMRNRRTGDPNQTRKPGRPRLEYRKFWRDNQHEMSDRTFDRFMSAMYLLDDAGVDAKTKATAIRAAMRPSGTINVTKFIGFAAALAAEEHNAARRSG